MTYELLNVDSGFQKCSVVVVIFLISAVCSPRCQNGGTCIAPNMCNCTAGYVGELCEIRDERMYNFLQDLNHDVI